MAGGDEDKEFRAGLGHKKALRSSGLHRERRAFFNIEKQFSSSS
ncbi:hypothetical protein PBAL39_18579 [Pedobacter sp. BAL39]|nr:hypothetical protein PBAL39_18579 [Pedobacter sp. BAL39]